MRVVLATGAASTIVAVGNTEVERFGKRIEVRAQSQCASGTTAGGKRVMWLMSLGSENEAIPSFATGGETAAAA